MRLKPRPTVQRRSRQCPQVILPITDPLLRVTSSSQRSAMSPAKASTPRAVMVGRAIEGMCKEKVSAKYLSDGLKELKEQGIIEVKCTQIETRATSYRSAHTPPRSVRGCRFRVG